ncbi:MAG: UDP-N-acetylglucosamine 4,6-dehydratase (inverting) [bacterium]|nr:UDP-N-acetylglucosamine 4,6-dehydratase (inverting) [bacterium]
MVTSYWRGKRVLVTGGTGTFGRAFIARLLKMRGIERVIVLSRDEYKQHEMQKVFTDKRMQYFLGDVRDRHRLHRAFNDVDIVVHAAALKQVPALEYNPFEAVRTNVEGTQNVIDAALDRDVERVVVISTDKAVHPINLYGATKLTAERLAVSSNAYRGKKGKTRLSVVRYGNVIGSRGSFIELIDEQKKTGVITLTDERMTRFWIHIDDVTKVVVEAIERMEGGEIFVPKMESLRITDVIKQLAPKCKVKIVGIRPGEKLHEALITEHEVLRTKDIGTMYAILPEFGPKNAVERAYAKARPFPKESLYISDHYDFLRPRKEVKRILKL